MTRRLLLLAAAAMFATPTMAAMWDQLCPVDSYAGASWIDNDTPSDAITADDFLCTGTGLITRIEWTGWSYYGEEYIDFFRIGFWSDVPEVPEQDASHPGDLLWTMDVPFGYVDPPECDTNHYYADIPAAEAFLQEQGTIYWVSIQGVMVDDDDYDAWYWYFRERHEPTWNDDAAFASDYFGYAPWANWGSPAGYGDPDLYDGILPADWTSVDMSFRLIPEPASLLLLGLGALVLRRR